MFCLFFFFLAMRHCGILAPQPESKPTSPALESAPQPEIKPTSPALEVKS